MGKHVEVIARGVCISGGSLLLCRSAGAKNTYLPGGHVEFEETARQGLEREILEELGRDSRAGRFLGAVEHSFIQKGKHHCEWNVLFELEIADVCESEVPAAAESHISFQWCDINALRDSRLEPAVVCDVLPGWLDDAFAGQRWASGGDFVG